MEADRLSGLFWLIFGLLCMYASTQLDLGSFREPGPGFFPFMAGCFFSLLALLTVISSFLPGRGQRTRSLLSGKRRTGADRSCGTVDFILYSHAGKDGVPADFSYSSFLDVKVG